MGVLRLFGILLGAVWIISAGFRIWAASLGIYGKYAGDHVFLAIVQIVAAVALIRWLWRRDKLAREKKSVTPK